MPATCALVTVDYPGFWDSTINKDTPHEKYLLKKKTKKKKTLPIVMISKKNTLFQKYLLQNPNQ